MLDIAFKNIKRQKSRSILTILGIMIGIGAIVTLGSIAEGIDETVQNSLQLSAGKITVTEKGSGFFGFFGELTDEDIDTIETISGIKDIVPVLFYTENTVSLQGPEWIAIGIDTKKGEYFVGENTEIEEGRNIEEGESGVAIIGKRFSEKYGLEVGDFWEIKGKEFEIVGIIERTEISDVDNSIIVPFDDLKEALNTDTFQLIYVVPEDVKDTERIAEEIEDASERLDTLTSKDLARQAEELVNRIRGFTFGIGAAAACIGGLGVMNTMIMAVIERRKEIGVMKAIGATNTMILKQILLESALISLIGGAGGIILGILGSILLNTIFVQTTPIVTPSLTITGMGFALLLGLIGGYYPAKKAAELDPVEALRYE